MKTAEENKKHIKKKKHRLRKFICFVLVFSIIAHAGAGNFIFAFALKRDFSFSLSDIFNSVSKKESTETVSTETEKTNWLTENSEDLYITSFDNLKLHALFAENQNAGNRYVIICHGYSAQASTMNSYAKKFFELNFNVLAVDARAHGKSEGTVKGMGWLERRDIILWVNEILQLNKNAQIVLYGLSMGAATVMMTAGEEDLPENVKCVIEDCGYTSLYDEMAAQIKRITNLPAFPLTDAASLITKIRGGYSFREASCVESVKRSVTPILFIHGKNDKYVPFEMLDELYNAAECKKEKLVIENAGHAQSASKAPELYWEAVDVFTQLYLTK